MSDARTISMLTEQGFESRLFEMFVRSECFGQISLSHNYKSQTVCKAPFLVGSLPVKLKSSGDQVIGQRHDLNGGSNFDSLKKGDRSGAETKFCEAVANFETHGTRGNQPCSLRADFPRQMQSLTVMLVGAGSESDRICGVEEDLGPHHRGLPPCK